MAGFLTIHLIVVEALLLVARVAHVTSFRPLVEDHPLPLIKDHHLTNSAISSVPPESLKKSVS